MPPSGTAPGLLLRPWAEEDAPALVDAHRDPVVRHWLRRPAVTAQEASRIIAARRADWRAGTAFGFAVVRAGPASRDSAAYYAGPDGRFSAGRGAGPDGRASSGGRPGYAGRPSPDGRPGPDSPAGPAGPVGDLVGGVTIRGLGGAATSGEVGYWVAARWRGQGIAPRLVTTVCEWAFRLPRPRPLGEIKLIHAVGNRASCRVAEKAGFALSAVLPPLPPEFPDDGHLHVRLA